MRSGAACTRTRFQNNPLYRLISLASSSQSSACAQDNMPVQKPVPVTLVAGFLGTGKTSTLKHLLENKENVKIGVIVNDVASVNIDSKLVAGMADNMLELQNGCACCSLADELFFSVERMMDNRDLDAIVVERECTLVSYRGFVGIEDLGMLIRVMFSLSLVFPTK